MKNSMLFKRLAVFAFAVAFALSLTFAVSPSIASAASASIDMPKISGITDSTKTSYKDSLFFVGEYEYAEQNYTLNYRYYMPEDMSEKVPLVIFLHGRGERGFDNDSQLNNAILRPFIENENSKFYKAMVIAPQCPVKEYNNGWVELFSDDESANSLAYANYSVDAISESVECKAIIALIKKTCSQYNVDSDRVYLIGLSQGAVATWDLLARHSDVFAAAVPISGVGDTSKASIYADIPIYAFHGDADTTVPYATATPKMYEAVNALGKNNMQFVTYHNGPHAIWEAAIVFKGNGELPALEDWLFSQTRASKSAQPEEKGCSGTVPASALAIGMFAMTICAVFVKRRAIG